MRVMALDIGQVRTGIAISDPQASVASPLVVLPTKEVTEGAPKFRRILEDWEPELLLCGLPVTLQNKEGDQAQSIRRIANEIAEKTGLPLEFFDERLSSQEAKRSLREKGMSERDMRGKIDMIAASLFLQTWLDSHKQGIE